MPVYDGDLNLNAFATSLEPDHPLVGELVREAVAGVKTRSRRRYTTFEEAAEAGAGGVRCAAGALYDRIVASTKPDFRFDHRKRTNPAGNQWFRCIDEIESDGYANCLEMALLYASCVLRAGLAPVLLVVEGEDADHALVGVWLDEHSEERNRLRTLGGTLPTDEIAGLIGADRFEQSSSYLEHLDETEILVVDCSGAAADYQSPSGRRDLCFESAVEEAWCQLGPGSS